MNLINDQKYQLFDIESKETKYRPYFSTSYKYTDDNLSILDLHKQQIYTKIELEAVTYVYNKLIPYTYAKFSTVWAKSNINIIKTILVPSSKFHEFIRLKYEVCETMYIDLSHLNIVPIYNVNEENIYALTEDNKLKIEFSNNKSGVDNNTIITKYSIFINNPSVIQLYI